MDQLFQSYLEQHQTTVWLFCVVIALTIYNVKKTSKNFPPGIPKIPILGSYLFLAPFLRRHFYDIVSAICYVFGPVVELTMPPNVKMLLISKYEAVSEAIPHPDLLGRAKGYGVDLRTGGRGLLVGDGPKWLTQKRTILRVLRDLGFGKRSAEGTTQEELLVTMRYMRQEAKRGPVEINRHITPGVLNVVLQLITGKMLPHDDPELLGLITHLQASNRNGNLLILLLHFIGPARILPGKLTSYDAHNQARQNTQNFIKKCIREHEIDNDKLAADDLIGEYLRRMTADRENANKDSIYTEEDLVGICFDMIVGAVGSINHTIEYAILYLALNPDIQRQLQEDVDQVVGKERLPSLSDMPRLPLINATISESLRLKTPIPIPLIRRATRDTKLLGYDVLKDTLVVINLPSVLLDKEYWGDPEVFRPQRFINSEGKFVKDKRVIVFTSGKRACIAETMSRDTGFLYLATLLQNFNFKIPPGTKPSTTFGYSGLTQAAKEFSLLVEDRMKEHTNNFF